MRVDTDFEGVIAGCAASRPGRRTTWINPKIRALYRELFDTGYCHTVEAWAGGRLVGGLYGVALNGAFFGESMFSLERDASKVALVYLCARLVAGGFSLLDTQFVTEHLKQFGALEIGRAAVPRAAGAGAGARADFSALPADAPPEQILAKITKKNDVATPVDQKARHPTTTRLRSSSGGSCGPSPCSAQALRPGSS